MWINHLIQTWVLYMDDQVMQPTSENRKRLIHLFDMEARVT